MPKQELSVDQLFDQIIQGNVNGLSRAITLTESTVPEHRKLAEELLSRLLPQTGNSLRIGITGVPGVGKSTFIESFGSLLTEQGKKVAVLAIDPTSQKSSGSILGDKTRMELLARNPRAFIRPSPAGKSLGGVTSRTRESILLCEAAGYDVIIVETVGVGQSETAVNNMTDCFLLLMLAGAGDELQGIKRGIMEMADLIAINKADQGSPQEVKLARAAYENALHLMPPTDSGWTPVVTTCSAITGDGIANIWNLLQELDSQITKSGHKNSRRQQQVDQWFADSLSNQVIQNLLNHDDYKSILDKIKAGQLSVSEGTSILLNTLFED